MLEHRVSNQKNGKRLSPNGIIRWDLLLWSIEIVGHQNPMMIFIDNVYFIVSLIFVLYAISNHNINLRVILRKFNNCSKEWSRYILNLFEREMKRKFRMNAVFILISIGFLPSNCLLDFRMFNIVKILNN